MTANVGATKDVDNLQSISKEFSLGEQYRRCRASYTIASVFLLNLCQLEISFHVLMTNCDLAPNV